MRELRESGTTLVDGTVSLPHDWHGSASFSDNGRYCYSIARSWHGAPQLDRQARPPYLACIGTNPSGAAVLRDSQTVRLLCRMAWDRGYYGMTMLNAYAWCGSPAELRQRQWDPVLIGEDNDSTIATITQSWQYDTLACWGSIPQSRDRQLREILQGHSGPVYCFGLTRAGQPKTSYRHRMAATWLVLDVRT